MKNIGESFSGLSGKKSSDFGHGEAKYITYLNILNNPIIDTKLTDKIEIDNKQHLVKKGDIFFTISSETPQEVGLSSVLDTNLNECYLNSFSFGYRLKEISMFDNLFNSYNFRSPNFRRKMYILAQGISRYNISKKAVLNETICFPKISEQKQIGKLIKLMNSLLSLQQRKLELEKQLKFFLFQNAIPSKEAVIFKPKIRFREFQDKWKYAKLSEIYNTDCSGGTPSVKNKTFYGGNIPFLTISDLNNKKIYKTQKTLSKKGLENSSAKLVPAGSISLAMYASVGKIGILSKEMATSQAFFNMTFDDDEKRDFIYIILEKANFDKEWIRLISTGTQNNLNAKKIRNFHIVFPTYKALKGLNKLFCNIDTDIDIQYKVIVTTNQLKQFLLQNLFI
ncbi:restriction endonuclease subunit S [Lactobacillus jensenii]|uniref:restriction endonuclease subunit S n=1 Tax=Lactobacillus jensenii TaxID=109790 RepID=UPI001F2460AB|nr:restriction endonuclease subunit S [Lactobacillus jensenii]MCZ9642236.1 restriction endonuclease subunit S [Lactobacillus jensenii]MCZ9656115.1 restriction endonuclease subunit S [Lactobacillus jensenii]MCZ9659987.1 restriction endonuclease subunit S [Lactobacillus jensenii]MCZ9664515.1 restriction endonuclease subunit S [Lactobacillus jensenii]